MRKQVIITLLFVLALGLMQSAAFAEKRRGYGPDGHHRHSINERFFQKVKVIHRFQDELNVTDDQLGRIRALNIGLKKEVIRQKAEMEIVTVDIRAGLNEDDIDVNTVNKLIDQKNKIRTSIAKRVVASVAEMKNILTVEQKEKLKDIVRDRKRRGGVREKRGEKMRERW